MYNRANLLNMRQFLFTAILLLACALPGLAQKVSTLTAEYTYYAPEDVSRAEAKRIAKERAILKALNDKYGTTIAQHNTTVTENSGAKSNVDFNSLSISEVNGEWLGDIGEPKYEISFEQDMMVVRCTITGKARERKSADITFSARVLRKGFDDSFESSSFKNGDDMFLSFLTPQKGFLAVYLVDNKQNAYCLFPYRSEQSGRAAVKANHRYVLFSSKKAAPDFMPSAVDEYVLTSNGGIETNYIYVVFSPNTFIKAADNAVEGLPRELSFENFQRWLAKNRTHDKAMQVDVKTITVKK